MRRVKICVLLFSFSVLTGCISQTDSDSISVTPAPSIPVKANTESPTVVIDETQSLVTETPIPTIPAPISSAESTSSFPVDPNLENFFFRQQPSGCSLPCWQGITIGQTKITEAKSILFDLYDASQSESTEYDDLPIGLNGILWGWVLPSVSPDQFGIAALYDETSNNLMGLSFAWHGTRFVSSISPQRTFRESEIPDQILVALEPGGQGEGREVRMYMIIMYEAGINFFYRTTLKYEDTEPSQPLSNEVTFCLNQSYENSSGSIWITEPLSNDFRELTPAQDYILGDFVSSMEPLQNFVTLSVAELTNKAKQEDNFCLRFTVDN